jgi:ubiquinone biosynthesis protein COQ4
MIRFNRNKNVPAPAQADKTHKTPAPEGRLDGQLTSAEPPVGPDAFGARSASRAAETDDHRSWFAKRQEHSDVLGVPRHGEDRAAPTAEGASVKLPERGLPYKPFTFVGEAFMHFREMALFVNAAARLIRSNGSEGKAFDGQAVFDLERKFVGTDAMKNTLTMVTKDDAAREVIQTKYGSRPIQKDGKIFWAPIIPDIEKLKKLPEGTLGREYAKLFEQNPGFSPDFYAVEPVVNDGTVEDNARYLMNRTRQTHDLWHIVTGFDASKPGEQALQAFGLAQMNYPLSIVIMAGDLFSSVFGEPDTIREKLESMALGYKAGLNSPNFVGIKFEEYFETPITEIREKLGLQGLARINLGRSSESKN